MKHFPSSFGPQSRLTRLSRLALHQLAPLPSVQPVLVHMSIRNASRAAPARMCKFFQLFEVVLILPTSFDLKELQKPVKLQDSCSKGVSRVYFVY